MTKRSIEEVIIHCSATRPNWMEKNTSAEKFAEIKRWHTQERGFNDIGYHYVIDRDGSLMLGRAVTTPGAHVAGHNAYSIGVCLIGGHGSESTDDFSEHYTKEQDTQLYNLVMRLLKEHNLTQKDISGHNEYANKACPGFNVTTWFARADYEYRKHAEMVELTKQMVVEPTVVSEPVEKKEMLSVLEKLIKFVKSLFSKK